MLHLALQTAKEAIIHNPNIDSLYFLAANILGQQNNVKQSEEHFKHAISLNPTVAVYQYNLAVLYHRNQMFPQAKEHYKQVLFLDPQHKGAMKQLESLKSQSTKSKIV